MKEYIDAKNILQFHEFEKKFKVFMKENTSRLPMEIWSSVIFFMIFEAAACIKKSELETKEFLHYLVDSTCKDYDFEKSEG